MKPAKDVSSTESAQVGFRTHPKHPLHSERGEANSPHEIGTLNQLAHGKTPAKNNTVKYR